MNLRARSKTWILVFSSHSLLSSASLEADFRIKKPVAWAVKLGRRTLVKAEWLDLVPRWLESILAPRGRASFGQHQESRPLARSNDIPVLNGFVKHKRLRPEPIRFVRLDSEHAQSDGKSVNRGLPLLDLARGRDSWCWPKGARPVGTRMAREAEVDSGNFVWWKGKVTGRTGSGRKCLYQAHAQSFDRCENLWPGHTPEVHESRTSRHCACSESSLTNLIGSGLNLLCLQPFRSAILLDLARGRDSWCWPKGARPLGRRAQIAQELGSTWCKTLLLCPEAASHKYLIARIQRRNSSNYYKGIKLHCSTSPVEVRLTFHKSSGKDGDNITTTINYLETDLPNLEINVGIDTIRNFSPKATVKHLG